MDRHLKAITRAAQAMIKRLGSSVIIPVLAYSADRTDGKMLIMELPVNPWIKTAKFRLETGFNKEIIRTRLWGDVLGQLLATFHDKQDLITKLANNAIKYICDITTKPGVKLLSVEFYLEPYPSVEIYDYLSIKDSTRLISLMMMTNIEIETISDSLHPIRHIFKDSIDQNTFRNYISNALTTHRRLYNLMGKQLTVDPVINRILQRMRRERPEDHDKLVRYLIEQPNKTYIGFDHRTPWNQTTLCEQGLIVPLMIETICFKNGHLGGRIRFDQNISWNNGKMTLSNFNIPISLTSSLIGEPLGKLLDHSDLDLTAIITEINIRKNGLMIVETNSQPDHLTIPN